VIGGLFIVFNTPKSGAKFGEPLFRRDWRQSQTSIHTPSARHAAPKHQTNKIKLKTRLKPSRHNPKNDVFQAAILFNNKLNYLNSACLSVDKFIRAIIRLS